MMPRRRFLLPGDRVPAASGQEHLLLQRPSLPVRVAYRDALPAPVIPLLIGGQGGAPTAVRQRYKGLTPTDSGFFPTRKKLPPWETPNTAGAYFSDEEAPEEE